MTHVLLIVSDRTRARDTLLALPGVRLSVVAKPSYARLYEGLPFRPIADLSDVHAVLGAALELAEAGGPFDAVAAPQERGLLAAGYVRSQLQLPGQRFDEALGFVNKLAMKARITAAGIPTAEVGLLTPGSPPAARSGRLRWPLVVKPAMGAGSQSTWVVRDPDELAARLAGPDGAALRALRVPLLAESMVPLTAELHCDGVVSNGTVVALSVSTYFRPFLEAVAGFGGSYTLPASRPVVVEATAMHARVVDVLGLRDGVTHLEAYVTGDGLVFGEIACRPGGGGIATAIAHRYGWDLWQAWAATATGRPFGPVPAVDDATPLAGWCGLPARNGRVLAMTPAADLAAVPGVRDVTLSYGVGDVIDDKPSSVFNAGIAHLESTDEAVLENAVAALRGVWRLEID